MSGAQDRADNRLVPWPEHSACAHIDLRGELSRSLIALGYQEQSPQTQMSVSSFWVVLSGVLVKAGDESDIRSGVEFTVLLYKMYAMNAPRRNALEAGGSRSSMPEVLTKLQQVYCFSTASEETSNGADSNLMGNKRMAPNDLGDSSQPSQKNLKIAGLEFIDRVWDSRCLTVNDER
jgi:hypothetical protein